MAIETSTRTLLGAVQYIHTERVESTLLHMHATIDVFFECTAVKVWCTKGVRVGACTNISLRRDPTHCPRAVKVKTGLARPSVVMWVMHG